MAEPKAPDGWNIAEMAGGLLLSAEGFIMEIDDCELDAFVAALNDGGISEIKDVDGDVITVEVADDDTVILTRANDKIYPHGIILPIDAFTEFEEDAKAPILEGVKTAFRRVGRKIKRGYRVTSGRRKGRVVANPGTANKPPISGATRNKLRIAAKRKTFIRALKSKMTRRKSASIRLRRMNKT